VPRPGLARVGVRSRRLVVRDAVEVSRRGGLVRVGDGMRSRHPVEPVSYGADLSCVLKWAVFCRG
jgi:hypothetical protein